MFYCIYSNYLHIRRIRSTSDLEKYKSKIKELRVWRNHQSSLRIVCLELLYFFFMVRRILIQYLNLNIYLKLRNSEKTVSSQEYRKRRKKKGMKFLRVISYLSCVAECHISVFFNTEYTLSLFPSWNS